MSEPEHADCPTVHCILAGHILHAVNLGYDEVSATHLRRCDAGWEAEIVFDNLGIAYVSSSPCPLEAALDAAGEAVETAEAMRECVAANVLH